MAVSIQEPTVNDEYQTGGKVAAPIFAEVMSEVMKFSSEPSNKPIKKLGNEKFAVSKPTRSEHNIKLVSHELNE